MITYKLTQNNPGTIAFIMNAYNIDAKRANLCFARMEENRIVGSKLYVLWNDCCSRDTAKTLDIMENNSILDIITHINVENGRGIPYN